MRKQKTEVSTLDDAQAHGGLVMCEEFELPMREQLKLILEGHERPWDKEPDYCKFALTVRKKLDETILKQTQMILKQTFECEIKRHPTMLHLCGYLSFTVNNPKQLLNVIKEVPHGGMTYDHYDIKTRTLTIGFDCAHAEDFTPGLYFLQKGGDPVVRLSGDPKHYKTEAFVRKELAMLAEEVMLQLVLLDGCGADICQEEV